MSELSRSGSPEADLQTIQKSINFGQEEVGLPQPVQLEISALVETNIATHILQDRARLSVKTQRGFYTDVTLMGDVFVLKLDGKIQRGRFSYPAVRLLGNATVYNGHPDGVYTINSQEEVGVNTKGSLKVLQKQSKRK